MRSQRGAVLMQTALVLVVLMGIVAVSVDIGVLMVHKRSLQAAADLAAMAGVQSLPGDPAAATATAATVLAENGVSAGEVGSITVENGGTDLVVKAGRGVSLFFARVLGFQASNVGVQARAHVTAQRKYPDLVPWALPQEPYVVGNTYTLMYGAPLNWPSSGNFQAVDLQDKMKIPDYEKWVANGYSGAPIGIGETRWSHPGIQGNQTAQGINERKARAAGFNCKYGPNLDPQCPMIVTVLIVQGYDPGKSQLKIVSFARFLVTDVTSKGDVLGIYLGKLDSNVFDPTELIKQFFLVG